MSDDLDKNIAYKAIRWSALLLLEAGCKMLMLLSRFYEQKAMYKIVETKYGFNIDFVIDKGGDCR